MMDNEILSVVEKNQVRGVFERVYSINEKHSILMKDKETAEQEKFIQMVFDVYKKIEGQNSQELREEEPRNEGILEMFYATDEEMKEVWKQVQDILQTLQTYDASSHRKKRAIGVITVTSNKE